MQNLFRGDLEWLNHFSTGVEACLQLLSDNMFTCESSCGWPYTEVKSLIVVIGECIGVKDSSLVGNGRWWHES